jgi:hypothetical protein
MVMLNVFQISNRILMNANVIQVFLVMVYVVVMVNINPFQIFELSILPFVFKMSMNVSKLPVIQMLSVRIPMAILHVNVNEIILEMDSFVNQLMTKVNCSNSYQCLLPSFPLSRSRNMCNESLSTIFHLYSRSSYSTCTLSM